VIERSHGKLRLTRPRMRDASVATVRERTGDRDALGRFAPGNAAATARTAKRSLTAALRAAAAAAVAEVAAGTQAPQRGAQVAQHALSLYRAEARVLATDSAMVRSHLVRWAVNTALGLDLHAAAIEQGADTDHGQRLIDLAHACEGRAERSAVAAATFAGLLAPRSPARNTVADHVLGGLDPDGDST
jgi:hypothetical protein